MLSKKTHPTCPNYPPLATGEFDRFEAGLSRRAANDEGKMVGGTCSSTNGTELRPVRGKIGKFINKITQIINFLG